MTAPTSNDQQRLRLSDEQRDALTEELFAHWDVLHPGPGLDCFCGDDEDLVAQVQRARALREKQAQQQPRRREQRERGDDEAEL